MSDSLLEEINAAVQAVNEAEQGVATAQDELVSRSKKVGLLLLEAKKLHPKVKDFEAFLGKVEGLKLSRAYDLLRLAGGRTTDDELKKDARERQAKSRAKKKKLPSFGSGDLIDLEADSFRDVTESAGADPEDGTDPQLLKWRLSYGVRAFCNVEIYRQFGEGGYRFIGQPSDVELRWVFRFRRLSSENFSVKFFVVFLDPFARASYLLHHSPSCPQARAVARSGPLSFARRD